MINENHEDVDVYDVGIETFKSYCKTAYEAEHNGTAFIGWGEYDAELLERVYNQRKHAVYDERQNMLVFDEQNVAGGKIQLVYRLNYYQSADEDVQLAIVLNNGTSCITMQTYSAPLGLAVDRLLWCMQSHLDGIVNVIRDFSFYRS
jgi:hypothetical protein